MKLRLLSKMVLFILIPAVLGLVVAGGVSSYLGRSGMRTQMEEDMRLVAALQTSELNSIMGLLRNVVVNMSELSRVRNLLTVAMDNRPTPEMLKEVETSLRDIKRNFGRIRDAGVMNTKGITLAHSLKGFAGTSLADRSYFIDAMQGKIGMASVLSKATNTMTFGSALWPPPPTGCARWWPWKKDA